ncbi:hypothetical protein C8J57DRAFT_1535374 [Mycena rebaudengoi]|nr:hypothetical protein C8J57DRAFT_1535374 [Mycena rebaudengoi]
MSLLSRFTGRSPVRTRGSAPAPAPSEEDEDNSSDPPVSPSTTPFSTSTPASGSLLGKRPAEDNGQFADQISRNLRLKTEAHTVLKNFAEMSGPQQSIWIAGHLLQNSTQLNTLEVPEAIWHIPTTLDGKIEECSFLILIDPKAHSYVNKCRENGPVARLLAHLEKHPSWGFTSEVKKNKARFPLVKTRGQDRFTHLRNQLKDALAGSVGTVRDGSEAEATTPTSGVQTVTVRFGALNIVELCQQMLAVGSKVAPDVKVSMEMAARVAYLRYIYQTLADMKAEARPSFWPEVDKNLKEVREEAMGDEVAISNVFAKILNEDIEVYGEVRLDKLVLISPALFE